MHVYHSNYFKANINYTPQYLYLIHVKDERLHLKILANLPTLLYLYNCFTITLNTLIPGDRRFKRSCRVLVIHSLHSQSESSNPSPALTKFGKTLIQICHPSPMYKWLPAIARVMVIAGPSGKTALKLMRLPWVLKLL